MELELVSSETRAKNGVVTPVAATPKQLAEQAENVVAYFQESMVHGRATTDAIIRGCEALVTFEADADFAKNATAKTELAKRLGLAAAATRTSTPRGKRYRAIGVHAKALRPYQDAFPPTDECLYELAKAFAPSNEDEKQRIIDAVKSGRLTTKSTLEDIRHLRKGEEPLTKKDAARRKECGRASDATGPASSPSDEDIRKDAAKAGITDAAKQQEVVEAFRRAEAADVVKTTSPTAGETHTRTASDARVFQSDDVDITDLVETDSMVSGRFVIRKRGDGTWSQWAVAAALQNAMNEAAI
jgi:hypothetical protein